jgi:signal transduction histidine kinase
MHTLDYGRAISSRAARYSANYYRVIIAVIVAMLLLLEAWHANLLLLRITVGYILLYGVYLLARLFMPDRWIPRYYTPVIQFARAQLGIVGLTTLICCYAALGERTNLWMLYILALMIISEHCETRVLPLTIIEIGLLLILQGYIGVWGTSPGDYLKLSPELITVSIQVLVLALVGFLLHYLVRNVDARNTTIARYRQTLRHLAVDIRSLHDPYTARKLALDLICKMHLARCGAIWVPDPDGEGLTLTTCVETGEQSTSNLECPAADYTGHASPGFSIPLHDDRLPACVARTQQHHFASRADTPPQQLGDALPAPRPFMPHARLELGISIPDFQPHQPHSHAVLCLVFDQPMSHDEMRQAYYSLQEMARYLTPFLYHASLLEQHQALQRLVQTVTHSLDRDRVLNTLLELVTDVFGFDFGTVSLVDRAENVIRTVCKRNADWNAVHTLDSDDIQADIIRTGKTEILVGWDDRFDQQIWETYGHDEMVRVFMPMAVADPITGEQEFIGTLETGYRGAQSKDECISREQVELLRPFVDQAAVAVTNAHLYDRVQATADALIALHDSGQAIQSAVGQPQQLLKQIGQSAEQVLGADIVMLFKYDEEHRQIDQIFLGGDLWGKGEPQPMLGEGNILDTIIEQRRPFYFSDAQHEDALVGYGGADGRRQRTFTQRQSVVSFAGVPLLHGEALRGIMCVNYRLKCLFSAEEKRLIELFAQQAAVALQIARQHDREQKAAVVRGRVAVSRELHGSTSSDLYAIALKARTALHYLGLDNDRAAHELRHIRDIAEESKRQLGYLLSEFSADDLEGRDFRDVLQEAISQVQRHFDIKIEVRSGNTARSAADSGDGDEAFCLPNRTHFMLSRIIKESLNNVVRHAHCQHVTISYSLATQEIFLEIWDDGIGFDPDRAQRRPEKFGLRNMQEYARELGCPLQLESAPGHGTRVAVQFSLDNSAS